MKKRGRDDVPPTMLCGATRAPTPPATSGWPAPGHRTRKRDPCLGRGGKRRTRGRDVSADPSGSALTLKSEASVSLTARTKTSHFVTSRSNLARALTEYDNVTNGDAVLQRSTKTSCCQLAPLTVKKRGGQTDRENHCVPLCTFVYF